MTADAAAEAKNGGSVCLKIPDSISPADLNTTIYQRRCTLLTNLDEEEEEDCHHHHHHQQMDIAQSVSLVKNTSAASALE